MADKRGKSVSGGARLAANRHNAQRDRSRQPWPAFWPEFPIPRWQKRA